jgi:hypothetical protein
MEHGCHSLEGASTDAACGSCENAHETFMMLAGETLIALSVFSRFKLVNQIKKIV